MCIQYAPMKNRVLSWLWDYLVILAYMGVLLAVNLLIDYGIVDYVPTLDETEGNLVSLTLILPVMTYFIVTESLKRHASFGKWKKKLTVCSARSGTVHFWQILVRNTIKFIPWQAAHMMLFNGFANNFAVTPYFIVMAVICYGLLILYLLFIFIRKDHRGLHDLVAGTVVAESA